MTSLVEIFSQVPDYRVERSRRHALIDVITIAICAVIAGAQSYNQIADWGKSKFLWLRKFLDLKHGIPSHDTINRVFSNLDPEAFQEAFSAWVSSINMLLNDRLVAIDGKTLRRSFDKTNNKKSLHLVSAWAHE